jgi:2-keto-4-pentenoate hydratase
LADAGSGRCCRFHRHRRRAQDRIGAGCAERVRLAPTAWLAKALARNGLSLRAGEIVLTGAIVTSTPVALPARVVSMGITGFETLALV